MLGSLYSAYSRGSPEVPPNELSQKGNEVRHTSIGVALKVQGEQDVGKFCHEVEQVLARLRQKNSALRQECIQTLGMLEGELSSSQALA